MVAERGDALDLPEVVGETKPDLVVIDIRMPPTHTTEGLEAAVALRKSHPEVAVIVLSQHIETRYAFELIEGSAEAVGYLLKDRVADIEEFVATVRRVAAGDTAIDPQVVARLLERERRDNPLDQLSDREREVLGLMAQGHDNAAIADHLVLNVRTVESHVSSVFTKLGLLIETEGHRRVKAVLTYLDHASA